MSLKIACLTPWNARSAIAHSASLVTAELERRGHDVTIFRTEQGEVLALPPLPAKREVQQLGQCSAHTLCSTFDVRLAHIGDHFGFSGALMPRLREFNAVGIFHDAFLAHLTYCWAGGNESVLRDMVLQTYGVAGWPDGQPFWGDFGDLGDLSEVMAKRPMLEWFSRQTVAAVGHAEHYSERLRASCKGPVAVIPLAFEYQGLPDPPPPWSCVIVATVGHVNVNKRVDQVILAIGSSPTLRSCCRVKVIGEATDEVRDRLISLSRQLKIAPPMFTGWVSNDDLPWQLRDVDVISCLRNPVLEGASASLILSMVSKRPTLVSDHGCYAELPDDVVLKCSPGREAVDVMRHLEKFVRQRHFYQAMGVRAAHLATHKHSASAYVDLLLPLLESVVRRQPGDHAARSLVSTLASFGLKEGDAASIRIQDVLRALLKERRINAI